MRILITLIVLSLWTQAFSQTSTCGDPSPLCVLNTHDFPLGSNVPLVSGNNFGCISNYTGGVPPVTGYFYSTIRRTGPIELTFNSNNNLSVAAWGPFPDLATAAGTCGNLPNPIACSANINSNSETITISGQVGEVFLIFVNGLAPPAFVGQFSVSQTGQGSLANGVLGCVGFSNEVISCPGNIDLVDCFDELPAPFETAFEFAAAGGNIANLCTDRIAIRSTDFENGGNGCVGSPRIINRQYSLQDQCGNLATCTQQISFPILDGPLELVCPPSDAPTQLVTCLENLEVNVQDITALNACGLDLSFDIGEPTINDASIGITCDLTCLHYPITVTDECGRVGECTLSFTVFGNVPEFIFDESDIDEECRLAPLDINCRDNITNTLENYLDTLSVFTTCGDRVNLDLSTNFDPNNFVNVCADTIFQSQEIIITAKDECGRLNTCRTTINIIKREGPSLGSEAKDRWVSCSENVDSIFQAYLADDGGAIAFDFCSATSFTTNPTNPEFFISCDGEDGLSIEFIASDECGNSMSTTGVFKVSNDTPPSVVVEPTDVMAECGDDMAFDAFLANQAGAIVTGCGDITFTTIPENPTAPMINDQCDDASIDVTFVGTDVCGQTIMVTATFTVIDTIAPTVSGGDDLDLACDSATNLDDINIYLSNNGNTMATDDCTNVTVSNDFDPAFLDEACLNNMPMTVTFTYTDDCGNMATQTQTISISDTTAPTLSGGADLDLECNSATNLDDINMWLSNGGNIMATDACTDVMVSHDFDPNLLDGSCPNDMPITVTFIFTDACGNMMTQTQTITITDTVPPVFGNIPTSLDDINIVATDDCDSDVEISSTEEMIGGQTILTFTAIDDCGNETVLVLTFGEIDNTPPVITFIPPSIGCDGVLDPNDITATDDNGPVTITVTLISQTGTCATGFTFTYEVTATDAAGNETTETVTFNLPPDNDPPIFTSVPENMTFHCSDEVIIPMATAMDECSDVTITCTVTLNAGAVVDNCNNGFGYDIFKVFTATDACGNSATTFTQAWVVPDDYVAPRFEFVPESRTIECGEDATFGDAICTTACGNVVLTFEDEIVQGDCSQTGEMIRTWTGIDDCGNATTAQQVITIPADTEAPVFTYIPESKTIQNIEDMAFDTPLCEDNCATFNHLDIDYTDTPLAEGCGVTRTWIVADMCGNATEASQTFFFDDSEAPSFSDLPEVIELNCGTTATFSSPEITDNLGEVEVVVFDQESEDNCTGLPLRARTWTAIDRCGNVSSFTQMILTTDQEAPIFEEITSQIVVSCTDDFDFDQAIATDNCGNVQSLDYVDVDLSDDNCTSCIYKVQRTWTAIDACGNEASISQTVTLMDQEAPSIEIVGDAVSEYTCGQELTIESPLASDNCGDVVITFEDEINTSDCSNGESFTRTWIATDNVGNESRATQQYMFTDNEGPVFGQELSDITLKCGDEIPGLENIFAVDNCDPNVEIRFDEIDYSDSNCSGEPILSRTYTASDDCGNMTILTYDIFIESDNEAPIFDQELGNITLKCGDEIPVAESVFATDNCSQEIVVSIDDTAYTDSDCSVDPILSRTYTATDLCGNMSTMTYDIFREADTEHPVLMNTIEDREIFCGQEVEFDLPSFEDNCGSVMNFAFVTETEEDACSMSQTRTWTATDNCGNATEVSQRIFWVDEEAPEVLMPLASLEMSVDQYLAWAANPAVDAQDNCSGVDPEATTVDIVERGDCEDFRVTYTYSFTDNCGNQSSIDFEVSVPNALPSFTLDAPQEVSCGTSFTATAFDIDTDNNSTEWSLNDPTGTWEIMSTSDDQIEIVAGDGTAELLLTATNQLGCATTQSQEIECSFVSSISQLTAIDALELRPNPVADMLTVQFTSSELLDADFIVYDLLGRVLIQKNQDIISGDNQFEVNASQLQQGTYILEIATKQGSAVKKFMKF